MYEPEEEQKKYSNPIPKSNSRHGPKYKDANASEMLPDLYSKLPDITQNLPSVVKSEDFKFKNQDLICPRPDIGQTPFDGKMNPEQSPREVHLMVTRSMRQSIGRFVSMVDRKATECNNYIEKRKGVLEEFDEYMEMSRNAANVKRGRFPSLMTVAKHNLT